MTNQEGFQWTTDDLDLLSRYSDKIYQTEDKKAQAKELLGFVHRYEYLKLKRLQKDERPGKEIIEEWEDLQRRSDQNNH